MFSKMLVLAVMAFCVFADDENGVAGKFQFPKSSLTRGADVIEQEPEVVAEVEDVEYVEISQVEISSWGRPYCPIRDDKLTLFPNLWNCRTFWMCAQGEAQLMRCPSGLRYNWSKRVCDWPENVKCWKF